MYCFSTEFTVSSIELYDELSAEELVTVFGDDLLAEELIGVFADETNDDFVFSEGFGEGIAVFVEFMAVLVEFVVVFGVLTAVLVELFTDFVPEIGVVFGDELAEDLVIFRAAFGVTNSLAAGVTASFATELHEFVKQLINF